jgi:peptide/nickel transport system substrate-binding protein
MSDKHERDEGRIHPEIPRLADELAAGRLDRREFLRFATLLGLSAGAAYGLAGLRPAAADQAAPKRGGSMRISMRVPEPRHPHTFSWVYDSNLVRQVNDHLTRTGPDNVTRPWLLERWSASDDLKTWTLYLRPDVTWSNGEPLVAEQVVWNIRRWLDPDVGSSMLGLMKGYMLDDIESGRLDDAGQPILTTRLWDADAIEQLDDHTIRLNCKTPQVAVPEHLFHYPAFILHPSQNGEWGEDAIGTGAFRPVEIATGKHAVFARRDGYWRDGPWLDEIAFIDHGDDPAAPLAAIASRQVHGFYEGSTLQYHALQALDHVDLHSIVTAQTAVARMQPAHKPFDDARVRKAMRMALDCEKLLQIGHLGLGAPGEHHHVAPIHPEYVELPPLGPDIDGAKALLTAAGYPDGFETEIACKKDPAWELITVQAMVEMWKAIGVRVAIKVMPSAQYWDVWTKVPFGFTMWTHRPLAVMTLPLAYRSGVPWNESGWANARMDELLTQAEGTLDLDARREIFNEIEILMQEEGPICQPLWRSVFAPMDKRVKGFTLHPTYYLFAEEWWLED